MSSLCPKTNQPEQDIVYTPRTLSKEIIDHFATQGSVLDPSRGDGSFYDQYPVSCEKHWCEIAEGVDFFAFDRHVDWIITNPPWSKMREFMSKGMDVSDNIVFLVTINHFMTKAGMRLMGDNEFGFVEIYGVATPKQNWPQSGFQLAAVHIRRNHDGAARFTGTFGK